MKAILMALLILNGSLAIANNTALSSGAWETGSNWSSGVAPTAADAVNIPSGITITVVATGDVCASLTIAATGSVIVNIGESLSIGGSLTNAGTFSTLAGSTLTFNGAANSIISGNGAYTIAGGMVMNMGTTATTLDVQDANFITGINSGGNYYMSFVKGTWKMDNTATLNDCYNIGSSTALTIPYGVVLESDAGTMHLCNNAPTGSAILSGKLFINGGVVNVQTGQGFNSGQDFQYSVNGGTPQLYLAAGTLNIGAGFNANAGSDYIDFHMTAGTIILALNGYSNWITFQLADVVGGKTFMSGGLIIMQDACNANIEDLDMGGANVAATQYSVTGGTLQLGYLGTQPGATYFGIDAQPATNYPNIDFEVGVPKNASAFNGGNINMLSLNINANMTFDATGFPNVNIISNNGVFAFDDEGGFLQATNTVTFSGAVPQLITSASIANEIFYNLAIANTSGHVILGVPTTINNQLSFASGLIDASNHSLTLTSGANAITGASSTSYIITGDGVTHTGNLIIDNIPTNTSTLFPIGNSSYYFPANINPGNNAGNSYAAFVFKGATANAMANGPAFVPSELAVIENTVWNISQTSGSGSASLALGWASSGTTFEGSSFQGDGTNIGISQYSGGGWQMATGGGNVATTTATSSFSSFSQFLVAQLNYILPLTISDFNAILQNNNSVLLSWTITDEHEISNFEIQRSNGGPDWKTIGVTPGNDKDIQGNYSFTDNSPVGGENYYRLKINNADGNYIYSSIRSVALPLAASTISVFPNPSTELLNVSLGNPEQETYVRLFNMSGQLLQSATPSSAGNSMVSMNVRNYPTGIYIVQVSSAAGILQSTRVAIAH